MLNVEQVRRLYWDEGISQIGIADMAGTSVATVCNFMKQERIPKRSHSESLKLAFASGRHEKALGKRNWQWQGGEHIGSDGYVRVLVPWHPFAQCMGHVRRARLVMEDIIGRFMKPEEETHHINHKRWDDRHENLMLFPTKGTHRTVENNLMWKLRGEINAKKTN
mgnify:CR=1 FL=1